MTPNKGPSLGEKSWLAAGRTQATTRPLPTGPGPGGAASSAEAGALPLRGDTAPGSRAQLQGRALGEAGRARGGRDSGAGRGRHRPAASRATAASATGLGGGESALVAMQRPGDVRRLSLVSTATGRAAGPGTICVCPQRGCGASRVWRSRGNVLPARGQAGDRTQKLFQPSEAGDQHGAGLELAGGRPAPLPAARAFSPLLR